MLLRECLWSQHQQIGDGAVTTAVRFEAVFTEGVRYTAAGGKVQHSMPAQMQLLGAVTPKRRVTHCWQCCRFSKD